MMPSFLQTAFLSGLAGLAVPVLIHLFFRLRTKRVELGTIRFLRIVLEENARRRKVMRWLLLALRMLFVALLVGMFARPYFTAAATGTDKDLLVVLIDQSATMQLKGENGSLRDQAIGEAKKLIEQAGERTRVEVAMFDHVVRPLTGDNGSAVSTSAASVLELLTKAAASPTKFGATNYGSAIAWARDLVVNAPAGAKRLHLFTDLQRSGLDWSEVEPLPTDVEAHLHDLGRPVVNNLAVTEIRTPRTWVRPGETATVRASITHGGAFALNEVPIVLEVGRVARPESSKGFDGEHAPRKASERATQSALTSAPLTSDFSKLSDRITKRERVKLEPGATVMLDFELPTLAEGLWQGRVTVEYDDDLAFDNQRYFAVAAAPGYRVLVVNGGEAASAVTRETYFVEAALRLANSDETYNESPFTPQFEQFDPAVGLPTLTAFDAVVLANVAALPADSANQLAAFVRGGGGLLIFTGERITAAATESLTKVGLTPGDIGEIKVTQYLPWRLRQWDEKHPIFQPLSDPQHGDLRRLIFAAYTQIKPNGDSTVLASFKSGDPAVLERRIGGGSALWVTVSCGGDWSDWGRSRLFLPLLHQLLGYQVGLTEGGRVRQRVVDAAEASGQSSEVRTAEARATDQSRDETGSSSKALASAVLTSVPGVALFDRYAEVINTSPRESDTEPCSRQDFEDRFGLKLTDEEGSAANEAALTNVELRQDEQWHWVACILLGTLLLEGFVGNRTTA